MALQWGPTLYSFATRLTDTKTLKFECGFSYDDTYSDNINFLLSFFPLIKNGTTFKYFIDNMDICQAILLLQKLLSNSLKEGVIINRPNKKVFIKKESEHMYRLYLLVPDNNVSIDMTTKEVYNLLTIFEMLKSSYVTLSCLIYASAIKYINGAKKNAIAENKQINEMTTNKEVMESIPLTSIINNSNIESNIPLEQINLDQAVKEVTSINNTKLVHNTPSEDVSTIADDVFGNNETVQEAVTNKPFTEHVGSNKTVDDLAKAIFG